MCMIWVIFIWLCIPHVDANSFVGRGLPIAAVAIEARLRYELLEMGGRRVHDWCVLGVGGLIYGLIVW